MTGRLLLVIPPVVIVEDGAIHVDAHFANNLRAYLGAFDEVVVACPKTWRGLGIPDTVPLALLADRERVRFIVLPEPYREDRYLRARRRISRLLRTEIEAADYLLFTPNAPFDWSTLATTIAMEMKRRYDMEGDWDLQSMFGAQIGAMRWGPNKLRKWWWSRAHAGAYLRAMRQSSVALLQGAEVYAAYCDIAPNPHQVLNVQVSRADGLSPAELDAKLTRIAARAPLRIAYAGRVADMKGPQDWIAGLAAAHAQGVAVEADWFGEGDLFAPMKQDVARRGLDDVIRFRGRADRVDALATVRAADLFLFCHRTPESPRCLTEALNNGTPIVGYGSLFPRGLVAERGGGAFVEVGDWRGLADLIVDLDRDRERLVTLVRQAVETAQLYDRDDAIAQRIALIKQFAGRITPGTARR